MENIILTTSQLTKQYKKTLANDNVTLQLPAGEIIGFVGENGSGKTTLLRMLTGIAFPTSGSVSFTHKDIRIGAMVESPAFFSNLSAGDNIRFQARLCGCDEKEALKTLETVGLADTGSKRVRNFSLGMKQRLGIAMALLNAPDLLILDEPTNGLDPQGIVDLRGLLEKLAYEKHITLLVSSHILSELSQLATYYIFINHGVIVETVRADELRRRFGKTVTVVTETPGAAEKFDRLLAEGAVTGVSANGNSYTLKGPFDYNKLFSAVSTLDVSSFETREQTLETYYLHLKGGAV